MAPSAYRSQQLGFRVVPSIRFNQPLETGGLEILKLKRLESLTFIFKMSQSNQGSGSFVPMDTDNDEISQVPSTSSTDTWIGRSGRATPTGLPPGTFARGEMRRKASQQRAAEEQNAVQAMVRRLERIDRVLSLYDQTLTTSQDADHLALNALPPTMRQLVT